MRHTGGAFPFVEWADADVDWAVTDVDWAVTDVDWAEADAEWADADHEWAAVRPKYAYETLSPTCASKPHANRAAFVLGYDH